MVLWGWNWNHVTDLHTNGVGLKNVLLAKVENLWYFIWTFKYMTIKRQTGGSLNSDYSPGNNDPIILSKYEILELKNQRGRFCNPSPVPSVKGQAKHVWYHCEGSFPFRTPFPRRLFSCTGQTACAGAVLWYSLSISMTQRAQNGKGGAKADSLFSKWIYFSHRNSMSPT